MAAVAHQPAANLIADSVIVPAVRIGASTYSREPFPKQIEEARENGYDYVEFDLTWVNREPTKLREEAEGFAKKIPLETAHFPPSHFRDRDLARFAGFMEALAPVGTRVFNVHLLQARSAPTVSVDAKIAWLADLAKAAKAQGVTVTVENLDETPQELRRGSVPGAGPADCLGGRAAHPGRAGHAGPAGRGARAGPTAARRDRWADRVRLLTRTTARRPDDWSAGGGGVEAAAAGFRQRPPVRRQLASRVGE